MAQPGSPSGSRPRRSRRWPVCGSPAPRAAAAARLLPGLGPPPGLLPSALWDRRLSWIAGRSASPHECFDYQTLLGYLAGRAGRVRLGVGVTEPFRRHPIVIAQAMITLAHLSRRPPILGIGAGERENTDPYGLASPSRSAGWRRRCRSSGTAFTSRGPFDFHGTHFRLDGAVLDLKPPPGRTPEIWIAAHGPRMLRLTGRYGDGWYPFAIVSPEDYATRLAVIHAAASAAGRDPEAITPSCRRTSSSHRASGRRGRCWTPSWSASGGCSSPPSRPKTDQLGVEHRPRLPARGNDEVRLQRQGWSRRRGPSPPRGHGRGSPPAWVAYSSGVKKPTRYQPSPYCPVQRGSRGPPPPIQISGVRPPGRLEVEDRLIEPEVLAGEVDGPRAAKQTGSPAAPPEPVDRAREIPRARCSLARRHDTKDRRPPGQVRQGDPSPGR